MKKVIAILMAALLVVSSVSIVVFGLSTNDFSYIEENGEATITAYNSTSANIVIPETIGGLPVTKIGDYAFANRAEKKGADISSLSLPAGLKEIGTGAFDVNSTVTSLTIPESVEVIGNRAFHCWIKLSSIEFSGNKLKTIGKWAFRNCHSLNSLNLPSSLEIIEEGAFSYCTSLSSVSIPESVKELKGEAFLACTNLSEAVFNGENVGIGDNAFDLTLLDASDSTKRALTVYGYADSSAQRFATAENFKFEAIQEDEPGDEPGDESEIVPAGSGPYYVKVTYTVTGSNNINKAYQGFEKENNDSAGISILCRGVNGTAAQNKEKKWDIGTQMKTTGTYTLTASLDGFPSLLYGYLDDNAAFGSAAFNINKLEVGSSANHLKTVWTGKICLTSKINAYGVSVDWNGQENAAHFGSDGNNKVENSSGAWEKPYAATFDARFENAVLHLDKNENTASNPFTYSATDQYGVEMHTSLCKSVTAATSAVADGKLIGVSFENGSGSASCDKELHLFATGENEQTITLNFNWSGKDKTTSFKAAFKLADEEYTISWLDENGDTIESENVAYGELPQRAVPEKAADDTYHYTGGKWTPEVVEAAADMQYAAVYEAVEHSFELDTERSTTGTCDKPGADIYVCTQCGYERVVESAVKEHSFVSETKAATCTEQGYTTYTCTQCNYSYTDNYVSALGHDFSRKEISEEALRSTGNKDKNPTYYYSCSRCDAVNRQNNIYFEQITASISGYVDMTEHFKPITVTLFKGEQEVEHIELEAGSNGYFSFYELEPADYRLVLSGESTTFAAFDTIDVSGGEKLNLAKSADSEVSLIALNNGDVNRDGSVDIADISCMLLSGIYACAHEVEDLNGDKVVDIQDIGIALLDKNYGSGSKHLIVK